MDTAEVNVNGIALRTIRERSGLTVTELANRVGVQQPTLTNIELGKRHPSPALARRLADELKIDLLAILAGPEAGES